ncbi:MAG TPA: hypothetical protein PKA41_16175 [Verrucomicrobiota bacterium]|nr:hypothetical protein [Verrucomicrobiota bacterium]
MDEVITRADGYRILDRHSFPEGVKNCDYRCGDVLIELKMLEKEAIESTERQQKLAAFFSELRLAQPGLGSDVEISKLPPEFKRRYWDIFLSGLENLTKAANRQIRETKQHLSMDTCRGAIFIINKECETIDPATVRQYVEHLLTLKCSSLNYVISFTAIPGVMDGKERPILEYYNSPTEHAEDAAVLQRIHDAFHAKFQELLGKPIPIAKNVPGWVKNLRPDKDFAVGDAHISLKSDSLSHIPGSSVKPPES